MQPSRTIFSRWCSASGLCAVISIIIWALWAGPNAGHHFIAPVLWLVMIALGMLTAWRAMLHGVGRQDWMSGGLFMFHVLSLLLLLFNLWSLGGRP